jgi:hypothetical protein
MNVLWKSPETFVEVKRMVGATLFTNTYKVVQELQDWLQTHQEFECEINQLKAKWRKRGGKNALILSTDPSIAEQVTTIIEQKWRTLEPTEFQEIYDYEFFSPSADKYQGSFQEGCMRQSEYVKELVHLRLQGILHDLYSIESNLSKTNWANDGTISQLLLGQDEPLFYADKVGQYSPFRKLYRDGQSWTLLWTIDKHTTAKYYLDKEFRTDLSKWTGANYESLDYEVHNPTKDTHDDTDTVLVTESQSQSGNNETKPKAEEFGSAPRLDTTSQKDAKPATITTERASQTTNPISSITQTNSYSQLDQYGMYGGTYPPGTVYNGPAYFFEKGRTLT